MKGKRYLIVNADDFGMSPGVNRGIIKTHECGITTSASLMVRRPAAAEAASYGRRQSNFSLGIHVDLGEWVYRAGKWLPIYQRVDINDAKAVAAEATSQLKDFLKLVGGYPTHLDSHQHVHRREPVRSILLQLANSSSRFLYVPSAQRFSTVESFTDKQRKASQFLAYSANPVCSQFSNLSRPVTQNSVASLEKLMTSKRFTGLSASRRLTFCAIHKFAKP